MTARNVFAFALVALTALVTAPTRAEAQDPAVHLLEQVLEVAHAVKASPAPARHQADADSEGRADGDSGPDAAAAGAPNGGVIPYARTVVQLFGRGVPVAPLADIPRSGTTLNVRPCRGGCVFRLRIGF
jgi:hypothetical protein